MIPRRVAFLMLGALILAVAGITAAATYEDDDDTPAALEQPVTTTTVTLPADTTTTVAPAPTTTRPTPSTVASATTTTRRGATTTTTRAGATTTTAGGAAVAPCTTAQMEARVSTDKASYGIGETVRIHSTLQNRSGTTCSYPSFVFAAVILSPSGTRVTGFDRVGESPGALGAGQANEAIVTWERVSCTSDICPPNNPGDYTVAATWNFPGGPYTATRTIRLT